ncbi:class I SAM-dependent methyltransferase [Streptomyces sp. NPDC055992]|uniref:class I SAM-dependent methyltransferase n=1 Tax=Streptomyces sp. NPDC055992 TaxID=3345673 RepID=UPI0035D5946D
MIPTRLYGELAWLWPVLEDSTGFARTFTDKMTDLLGPEEDLARKSILHLGCGGGRYDQNLAPRFARLVGVDQSAEMLDHAAKACPTGTYVQSDMRELDLDEKFDFVFIDDAMGYMLGEEDVRRALDTAVRHLRPDGRLVLALDEVGETCPRLHTPVSVAEAQDRPDGLEVVYFRSYYKPVPEDPRCLATFIFVIHQDGERRVEVDEHLTAVRHRADWRRLLEESGLLWEEKFGGEWGTQTFYRCRRS